MSDILITLFGSDTVRFQAYLKKGRQQFVGKNNGISLIGL